MSTLGLPLAGYLMPASLAPLLCKSMQCLAALRYFLFQAYSPRDEPMGRCIRECSPSFAAHHAVHLCDTGVSCLCPVPAFASLIGAVVSGDYVTLAERAGFEVVSTELVHSEGRYPQASTRAYTREFIVIVLRKPT